MDARARWVHELLFHASGELEIQSTSASIFPTDPAPVFPAQGSPMIKTVYGIFDGDSWEDFCQQCLKLKHEADGYQEMPAWQGDLGIEGYTRTGVLFQCYCPDEDYNPDLLYEKQRDKITADLKKLKTYETQLASFLGEIKVVKWIFITPDYKNKDLVSHCKEKAIEYQASGIGFLDTSFDVLVHDIEFFSGQIPTVLNFRQQKINIDPLEEPTSEEIADWRTKNIPIVDTALTKHAQQVPTGVTRRDSRINQLTQRTISDFLNGYIVLRTWKGTFQDQYEKFTRVVTLFEERVKAKCATHDGTNNSAFYEEIEDELRSKLKESFDFLDDVMIERLTNQVMADWILRCPISFE